MKPIKISISTVKSYEFKGTVSIDDLSPDQLNKLGILQADLHDSDEIDVEGCFSVYASQDESEIDDIEYVSLIGNPDGGQWTEQRWVKYQDETGKTQRRMEFVKVPSRHVLDLDLKTVDTSDLESQLLEHDDGSWYQDHLDAEADRAYDSYRDRELEDKD